MPTRLFEELEAGLDRVRLAPADIGVLRLIVSRPEPGRRELQQRARLDLEAGLVGDCWATRGSSRTRDGSAHPGTQVTVMSSRVAELVAGSPEGEAWAPAGDQLYVDLDLSEAALPAGARLAVGDAVLEVTAEPHLGCGKFVRRFGVDALKLVNSRIGRELRLRGVNTRVVRPGEIAVGDLVRNDRQR